MKFKVGDKVRINWNLYIYIKVCMDTQNGIVISKEEYSENNILYK
jgi:hypothetical protein